MYTGFIEEYTPEGHVFYLLSPSGGQMQAAVGKPQPAPDGGLFYVYFGNHPAAAPLMTQDKEELVSWLEAIVSDSNKTMQQEPAMPLAAPAAPAAPAAVVAAQPAQAEAPMPTPPAVGPEVEVVPEPQLEAPQEAGAPAAAAEPARPPSLPPPDKEMDGAKEEGGPSAPAQPPVPSAAAPSARPRRVTAAAQRQQQQQHAPASRPGFRFVSYRDEVRGLTEHGNPPRRLRHWLLTDGLGREHVAVDTIAYHQGKKRFTYAAVEPFSQVRPLTCYNTRSVLEYMDQFVPPEVRQAPPSDESGPSPRPAPKSTPKKGCSGAKTKGAALAAAPAPAVRKQQAMAVVQHRTQPGSLITDQGRRAEAREARVATVAAELEALAAECGVQYSLTLMDQDGMEVLTSGTVQQAQPEGVALPPPPAAALPPAPRPSREQSAPATAPPSSVPAKGDKKHESQQKAAGKKRPAPLPSPAATADCDGSAPPRPRAEKRQRRSKQLTADPVDDVAALVASMESDSNTKMYVTGRWHRDSLAPHPLEETLEAFMPAEDCGEAADRDSMPARLQLALPTDAAAAPGVTAGAPTNDDVMVILDHGLPVPVSEKDVKLQATWGLDAYTRQLLTEALARCPETPDDASRAAFMDKIFLPALNSLGEDGWDVLAALRAVEHQAAGSGMAAAAARVAAALEGLEAHFAEGKQVKPTSRKHVRAHPKGEGVVVTRRDGLPAGTFLGEYLGEVVSAWRWAEREAAGRGAATAAARRHATRMGASSEYYNITLERPKNDEKGYDVLYVDAVRRGNFVSRLGHACEPNCRSVTVAVNGRLTVGVWTMRDVAAGEELTLDFAGETENEREAAAAVCLCGTEGCRGSFLYVNPAPGSSLNAVAESKMTPPDRLRMLLHAAAQSEVSPDEEARLAAHGFKDLLLKDATGVSIPVWLRSWTAAALQYIEEEAAALRTTLPGTATPSGDTYTAEEAEEDAEELMGERIHSLATVMDRAKLFLRHQDGEAAAAPPLVPLDDAATAAHLWTAPDSVARRLVAALAAHAEARATAAERIGKRALRQGKRPAVAALLPRWAGGPKIEDEDTGQHANGNGNAESEGGADDGSGDADELRALAERLSELIDTTEATTADAARAGLRSLAAELLATGRLLHLAAHDILTLHASTRTFIAMTEYSSFASMLANGREGARYRPSFLLSLLAGWPRTGGDEHESHNVERRGCLCLPDIESAYAPGVAEGGGKAYATTDRGTLLRGMAAAPRAPWSRTLCTWLTFRSAKVYGSPQLDAVLRGEGGEAAVAGLAEAMLAAAKG